MKLKAFTMTEALVVMLLAVLIALAAFSSLQMMTSMTATTQQESIDYWQIHNGNIILKEDFDDAHSIVIDDNYLSLENKKGSIDYVLEPPYLIRNTTGIESRPDTIVKQISNFTAQYQGTKVDYGWIDQLTIQVSISDDMQRPLVLFKRYSSAQKQLINNVN